MNKKFNALLKESRLVLEAQSKRLEELLSVPTEDTTPQVIAPVVAPDAAALAAVGSSGYVEKHPLNDHPTGERLDGFLINIIRGLMATYSCSKDDAVDLVFEVAEDLAEDGTLPELPDGEGDSEASVLAWISAAEAAGFADQVFSYAEDEAEEDGEAVAINEPEIEVVA